MAKKKRQSNVSEPPVTEAVEEPVVEAAPPPPPEPKPAAVPQTFPPSPSPTKRKSRLDGVKAGDVIRTSYGDDCQVRRLMGDGWVEFWVAGCAIHREKFE